MKDNHGREINYLRLSVTERCTLKCAYCRAGEGLCPKSSELSLNDLMRIVRIMAKLGITKVRLTGGEPMLRREIVELISDISSTAGIREVTMTTNAQHLPGKAAQLKKAGLTRLNISIDSLDPDRYREMTGGGELEPVLIGIEEALAAGLSVKLNAVLMRGKNDDEADAFMLLAKDKPLDVRFIELMPLGAADNTNMRITTDELLARHPELYPIAPRYPGQPSSDYTADGYAGRVGFISPISHKFCDLCSRIRVMSDGMLRPCLGNRAEVSLLPALAKPDDAELERVVYEAILNKPDKHSFGEEFSSEKNMSRIGG